MERGGLRSLLGVLLVLARAHSFAPHATRPAAAAVRLARPPAMSASPPEVDEVPMRVQLIVEPTPFTHVSGYANRFKEYLKYQKAAGAEVSIITPDDSEDAPKHFLGYPIATIRGFRFPLYKQARRRSRPRLPPPRPPSPPPSPPPPPSQIYLSWGISPIEGMREGLWRRLRPWNRLVSRRKNKLACLSAVSEVIDEFEPDLVHVTSPGFIPYMTTYIAREWKDVPLVMSYHTHIPVYARTYAWCEQRFFTPLAVNRHIPVYARTYAWWLGRLGEWLAWSVIRQLHDCADLTVVPSVRQPVIHAS